MDTDVVKLYPFSEHKQPYMYRQMVYVEMLSMYVSYLCCCWFNISLFKLEQ